MQANPERQGQRIWKLEIDRLTNKLLGMAALLSPDQRLLIGIGGAPGSGKTSFAKAIVNRFNNVRHSYEIRAEVVSMDGFHYPLEYLNQMDDPEYALARRGAPFTFDAKGFLDLVHALRSPIASVVYAPSFDHATKDPIPKTIKIDCNTRIVILEGNYLCFAEGLWKDAAALMNELWFIHVDIEIARKRLVARHLSTGVSADLQSANKRVTDSDLLNLRDIHDKMMDTHEFIISTEW